MDTAERYERFADHEVCGYSPSSEEWSRGIACDPELLGLINQLPADKRRPNLVLAAARFLGAEPSGYPSFKAWMIEHWDRVAEVALARLTQTNEPGRTASLLPLLAQFPGPLTLIEVGASAGLCLYPDRYSYRYDERLSVDPADGVSPVVLRCTTAGDPPLPSEVPEVVSRMGIDLNPLDVNDAGDMAWLEALVWPEQQHRLQRLRAAADIARADPPALVAGNLLDTIADVVDAANPDTTVVVFGSAVLTYLDPPSRRAFETMVRDLRCKWIANEGTGVIESLTAQLPKPPHTTRDKFVLSLNGEPMAYTGPHGQSLDWIADIETAR
ncbi:DUF2332 domain-containing protein [Nocardia iowensis]|uniref:DUF2332 domain-containing protein n=1 Tax=Nocardia iowensis TaxID=204891 RepID=A0ABX8RGU7_NOCIO|nr:DUF2332 domain-containing protein [Nocardia iowensis]QXN88798.1 DUF2332 domain-containing protein [Nocardia iowensis]